MSEGFQIPLNGLGEWLQGKGPDADIALCTRVRFARNVQGFRFSTNMTADEAAELDEYLRTQIEGLEVEDPLRVIDLGSLGELERLVLMERHLISRDHASADRSRSVAVNSGESVSIMINEEDHLRTQVFQSGFRVPDTYGLAEHLDETLLGVVPLAFSEEFGFLTSCPTNTGTGLRVSVMLHLPGLVWAEEMDKAVNTTQKIHLAVRGLYGEGSRAIGDFYQVSNQVTLGRSEEQILEDVETAVESLITWERKVRDALLKGESPAHTMDRIFRALGTLQNAHILSSEECLNSLSAVRCGVQQGMIPDLEIQQLNRVLLLTQPAHLQRLVGRRLDPAERDVHRARMVRKIVSES